MKKVFKNPIFTFILGIILCCVTIVIAESINSDEVLYDNSNSSSSATDVQGAIDDLYNKVIQSHSGYKMINHIDNSISEELESGMYRYQGENPNNYICFGTTNISECTSNPDNYLYRIIGFDSGGKMKLIKHTSLGLYTWNSTNGDVSWPQSTLFSVLNGSDFLNNSTYIPDATWSNRILDADWHYGRFDSTGSFDKNAEQMTTLELGLSTVNAKVGLLYLHDYYYGIPGGKNCQSNGSVCKTSWLYHNNTWTMLRAQVNYGDSFAYFYGYNSGFLSVEKLARGNYNVFPTFYLKSTEKIAGGLGTIDNPYILGGV